MLTLRLNSQSLFITKVQEKYYCPLQDMLRFVNCIFPSHRPRKTEVVSKRLRFNYANELNKYALIRDISNTKRADKRNIAVKIVFIALDSLLDAIDYHKLLTEKERNIIPNITNVVNKSPAL